MAFHKLVFLSIQTFSSLASSGLSFSCSPSLGFVGSAEGSEVSSGLVTSASGGFTEADAGAGVSGKGTDDGDTGATPFSVSEKNIKEVGITFDVYFKTASLTAQDYISQ